MAHARGPLHSHAASGTYAHALTFRHGRHGVVVHAAQRQKTRHSSVELANRILIAGLNAGWAPLNATTRNLWNDPDRFLQTHPRLAYIRTNATRANAGDAWGALPDLTPMGSPIAPAAPTPPTGNTLHVSGTLTPDATGTYNADGTYNGATKYNREDGTYWLWWTGALWLITTTVGTFAYPAWVRPDGPTGVYMPAAPTEGKATVTAPAPPTPEDPAIPLYRSIRVRYQNPDVIVGRPAPDWLTEVYLTATATAQPPAHSQLAAMALALPLQTTKTLYLTGLRSGATYSIAMRNRNKVGDVSPVYAIEAITVP